MGSENYGQFHLSLLHSWSLRRDGESFHVAPRQQRLITALALRGPRLRSYLVGLLWPEHPDNRALENLRVSLHMVCHDIPGLVVNAGPMLSLSDRVVVDLHRIWANTQHLEREIIREDASSFLHCLRDAELLPGWYEDWVVFEQNRLHQDRLRALTKIAHVSYSRGQYELAAEAAEAALEVEPLYESAVRLLVQAQAQQGDIASAVQVFERFQRKLVQDMGLRPSQEALKLIARVRVAYGCTGNEGLTYH
jgi:DNA-binding SARP family transcriptional activator